MVIFLPDPLDAWLAAYCIPNPLQLLVHVGTVDALALFCHILVVRIADSQGVEPRDQKLLSASQSLRLISIHF